ncbi:MAG TPA: hypothetical protein VNL14_03460 [Candidatus Acidoferrales bacterium]|nr:hypothetical protein [Candidatus Acidoferrales bacterium]
MLVDTSVARNFAVIGWTDHLVRVSDGAIRVAHGILGLGPEEPGELDRAREFFERQTGIHPAGSPEYASAVAAMAGLENLISRRSRSLEVVIPSPEELKMAIRLQAREEREWRRSLGMKARRLHSGEAVSVAICVSRSEAFACDEQDARIAYEALGGKQWFSTLDLLRLAVRRGLLHENEARSGYEKLRASYRFYGPPWY